MSETNLTAAADDPAAELRAVFITVRDLVLIINASNDSLHICSGDNIPRFTPIPLVGKTLDDVLSPAEAAFFRTHIRQAIEEGKEHQVEYSLQVGDEQLWFDARVAPVTTDMVLWLAQDVTRPKRAEEKLRYQMKLAETMMGSLSEGVFAVDEQGILSDMNPAAEEALGWKQHELLGREIHDVILCLYPDGSPRPIRASPLLKVLRSGETSKVDRDIFVARDGTLLPVAYTASPVLNEERVIGAVVAFRDATGPKEMEEQKALARELEALSQLAGAVAHDFNNLLTVIIGFAAHLLESPTLAAQSEKELRAILAAGERAAALTGRLLAFGRPQIDQPSVFSLNEMVKGLEAALRRLLPEEIELSVHLASEACYVKADKSNIERVLRDLVLNAREAMPSGGTLEIETARVEPAPVNSDQHTGTKSGAYVALVINNSGRGIQNSQLNHIFEPFFTAQQSGAGAGFGLSTVTRIVEQSGGNIHVESLSGLGALYIVFLPAYDGIPARRSISYGKGANLSAEQTILLVEDDPSVRGYLETALKRLGYKVLSASDGEHAQKAFHSEASRVDLLMTDAMLSDRSGPTLAHQLRSIRPELKVLFMSGDLDDQHVRNLPLETGSAFLAKPFSPEVLASKVREVLITPSLRPKVLIADDDVSVRALLASAIETAGFETLEAGDGREALRRCAEAEVDVVVMDLAMPGQEGLETIPVLRRCFPKVPIIAISGLFASSGVLSAAKHLGASAVFSKPLDVGILIDALRRLIRDCS